MSTKKTILGIAAAGVLAAGTAVAAGVSVFRKNFSYDMDGFNAKGFDKEGYDREGYNKDGYNREGYDREGLTAEGYDKDGYNKLGRDKSGFTREGYTQKIYVIEKYIAQAKARAKDGDYETAFLSVRKGLEQGVRCVLSHKLKESYSRETLFNDIEICKTYQLLDENFISRLHLARMNCNEAIHGENERRNAFYASLSVLEDLTAKVREMTGIA